jgi:predicted NUDIX family NTP pyrophosphohydrolase
MAMAARSAGILLYKRQGEALMVLLVHPGGPFWAKKDLGAWSIPKGEHGPGDDPRETALREFEEELGHRLSGELAELGEAVQAGRKRVVAFALEGDLDVREITSNTFELEWPPRSGRRQLFPEVDRAEWLEIEAARQKILEGQRIFLDRLVALIRGK